MYTNAHCTFMVNVDVHSSYEMTLRKYTPPPPPEISVTSKISQNKITLLYDLQR